MTKGRKRLPLKQHLLKFRKINTTGCWLWTKCKLPSGYGIIKLKSKNYLVHRLIASLWLNFDLNDTAFICHKCNNPSCFNPKHLYIGNHQANMQDMSKAGNSLRGERHWQKKLTWNKVQQIHALRSKGVILKALAESFNVSISSIWFVLNDKQWRKNDKTL